MKISPLLPALPKTKNNITGKTCFKGYIDIYHPDREKWTGWQETPIGKELEDFNEAEKFGVENPIPYHTVIDTKNIFSSYMGSRGSYLVNLLDNKGRNEGQLVTMKIPNELSLAGVFGSKKHDAVNSESGTVTAQLFTLEQAKEEMLSAFKNSDFDRINNVLSNCDNEFLYKTMEEIYKDISPDEFGSLITNLDDESKKEVLSRVPFVYDSNKDKRKESTFQPWIYDIVPNADIKLKKDILQEALLSSEYSHAGLEDMQYAAEQLKDYPDVIKEFLTPVIGWASKSMENLEKGKKALEIIIGLGDSDILADEISETNIYKKSGSYPYEKYPNSKELFNVILDGIEAGNVELSDKITAELQNVLDNCMDKDIQGRLINILYPLQKVEYADKYNITGTGVDKASLQEYLDMPDEELYVQLFKPRAYKYEDGILYYRSEASKLSGVQMLQVIKNLKDPNYKVKFLTTHQNGGYKEDYIYGGAHTYDCSGRYLTEACDVKSKLDYSVLRPSVIDLIEELCKDERVDFSSRFDLCRTYFSFFDDNDACKDMLFKYLLK